MDIHNIRLVNTSHISEESVDDIKEAFDELDPDLVAVELDAKRMHALMMEGETKHPPTLIARVGILGYLFALVGSFMQKKLGGLVGTKPGVEMLAAIKEAQKREKQIFLIDQDVEVTLRRLSDEVPFREKMRLVSELVTGFFRNERIDIDLRKVPSEEVIQKMTDELLTKFPNIYRVLVEERNEIMARRLEAMARQNPDKQILAVIGAGHGREMKELLEERLEDL